LKLPRELRDQVGINHSTYIPYPNRALTVLV
jgi:hypothetical protein